MTSSGAAKTGPANSDAACLADLPDVPTGPQCSIKASVTSEGFTPIAICGMSCRLPGGLITPQQLWDFIIAKGDARSRVPANRYNVDAFYSTTVKPNAVATEYGYFLDQNVDLGAIDTSFFSMPRTDLEAIDPQERLSKYMQEIGTAHIIPTCA
ncbi:hypothetical protein F5Y16DRAFT_155207 [Xylariaceae sp. FL0255]|nr:hypothetical protein F5Y16DRAFT_155207 [Xylariaceae sp. FL0255]